MARGPWQTWRAATAHAPALVDAFRGLTMAGMVIVNNPGDWNAVYAPLLHAEWHGWTPTDLIFPWFLVIMGVSMALAGGERTPWPTVLRRAATIAGLGAFMAGYPLFQPGPLAHPGRARADRRLLLERVCDLAGGRPSRGSPEDDARARPGGLGSC